MGARIKFEFEEDGRAPIGLTLIVRDDDWADEELLRRCAYRCLRSLLKSMARVRANQRKPAFGAHG